MIITVDCGATNMRCRLFENDTQLDEVKVQCGTRNTAFAGSASPLEAALRESVTTLLERNKLTERDVEMIVSAGTLASNAGIYHVPHAPAPIGVSESAAAARAVTLPHICSIPILFIPGVCVAPQGDEPDELQRIARYDSMGGEECETYGIMKMLGISGDVLMVMPGSYCQTFELDGKGRIVALETCMCGDLIAAISEHTFLKKTLPSPVIREIDREHLILGYEYCAQHGTSNSLIKSRMIQVWGDYTEDAAANFLVGAILHDNIVATAARCHRASKPVILGGGAPLRDVFHLLLTHVGVKVTVVDDDTARIASSLGALTVYRQWRSMKEK